MPKWVVYSILAIVLYGFWGVVPKWVSRQEDPETPMRIQVLSTIGILPVALVFIFSKKLKEGKSIPRGVAWAVATGLCGGVASLALYAALVRGQASTVLPFMSPYPIIAVVLALLFLKERPNLVQCGGIALALVAMFLLSY